MANANMQAGGSSDANGIVPGSEQVLDGPQFAIVLPPTADGASFKAWQHHLTFACSAELVEPRDAPAFQASTSLYMLDRFILSESTSSHANRLSRTAKDSARTGVDHVNISPYRALAEAT